MEKNGILGHHYGDQYLL